MISSGKSTWQLLSQPLVVFLALGLIALWISSADLTTTEQVTLTVPYLWELTMQHLSLTLVAALVVLITAIPLGVLLTRKPLRWLTTPVMMLGTSISLIIQQTGIDAAEQLNRSIENLEYNLVSTILLLLARSAAATPRPVPTAARCRHLPPG